MNNLNQAELPRRSSGRTSSYSGGSQRYRDPRRETANTQNKKRIKQRTGSSNPSKRTMNSVASSGSKRRASSGAAVRNTTANRAVARPKRRNINPNEERRKAQRRAYLKKRRQQVRRTRLMVLFALVMMVYLTFRVIAGIIGFIEANRELQRGGTEIMETVENYSQNYLSEEVPTLAAEIGPGEAIAEAKSGDSEGSDGQVTTTSHRSSDGSLDTSDPTHIFSGGRYIDSTKPMIAFTFDDGPKSEVDNQLMEELEKVDGRATFFIVGNRVSEFSDHVKKMHDAGHEIANHSWDHDTKMNKQSVEYIRSEFSKADEAIQAVTGDEVKLYRLPGGNISDNVRTALQKPLIYWSIDTLDWKSRDAASVTSIVRSEIKDGDIVLMHALYQSTADACKTLIPELAAQGYQFVTVSELIALRGEGVSGGNGKQYSQFRPKAVTETTAAETSASSENNSESSENSGSSGSTSNSDSQSGADSTGATLSDNVLVGPGAALSTV